jgi:GT2 family glycosyltransferase
MKIPKIDVRIPYEPNGKLGFDYNRVMKETPHNWVLFLDHDIFLALNPHWYYILQNVIQTHEKQRIGMITCKTNINHKETGQYDENSPQGDSIEEHRQYARVVWDQYQFQTEKIQKASGFFMLVNKRAWGEVGGFIGQGLFREDWVFSRRLSQNGFDVLCLKGLYVYHARHRQDRWIDEDPTTKDYKYQL